MLTIAVAGKGGVGKTAIAGLLVDQLSRKGTVLAVDADPSTNLNLVLGLPVKESVGRVREVMSEDIKKGLIPPSLAKQEYLDIKIMEAMVESDKIDLLAMGRPEGPGCYCAANNMLRQSIDKMAKKYDYTVVDCEAGMEHISRQTTRDIDVLLVVADPTVRAILTASQMQGLMRDLRTKVGKIYLVINRVKGELPPEIKKAVAASKLELIETIPEDPNMGALEVKGEPLTKLPSNSPLQKSVAEIISKLGI